MNNIKSHQKLMDEAYAKWAKQPLWTPATFFIKDIILVVALMLIGLGIALLRY